MADDPSEHDLTAGSIKPVPRSTPPPPPPPPPPLPPPQQLARPEDCHQFPVTIAEDSLVASTTPVKPKIARKAPASGSENEDSPHCSGHTPTTGRPRNSLASLTEKLLKLFDEAPDKSLELSKAAEALKVHKRRLYDITNVLEGIGLIEKKHKNEFQFKSGIRGEASSELDASVFSLKASIKDFVLKEQELDEQISEIQGRIKKFIEDENTKKLAFITKSDLKSLPFFENQTLLVVRAPQGTTLEAPDPNKGDGTQRRYTFTVRSSAGPIQVYLVSEQEEEDLGAIAVIPTACPGVNERSESTPSADANLDDTDYRFSSTPDFSISDLWDISPELAWDHLASEGLPAVSQTEKQCSTDLDVPPES